jgi:hypothetical protein
MTLMETPLKLFRYLIPFLLFPVLAFGQVGGWQGNFQPINGAGVALATSTTSASTTFTAGTPAGTNTIINASEVYLYNSGTVIVFCRWGTGAQTATATDVPLPAGTVQVFFKGTADTVACLASSTTSTVYVMPGNGR